MLQRTNVLLRRGMPRPRRAMFPDKYRRVPQLLKPMQGGQNYFHDFMVERANDEARLAASGQTSDVRDDDIHVQLPQAHFAEKLGAWRDAVEKDIAEFPESDAFTHQRSFNERQWYEEKAQQDQPGGNVAAAVAPRVDGTVLPTTVVDNEYFQSRFGYSMVKDTELENNVEYSQLDLWGELPKYNRKMFFLYLVSRRRNTYAVMYDYEGKRLLRPYTVGNRGLKGGDRGFRNEGSTDNGHQVASMYLNDVIPVIREKLAAQGTSLAKGDKVELVVRVLGFYNGRQGAVRAVTDRSDLFTVRYFEDITPFPLNGPKMPRGVFK